MTRTFRLALVMVVSLATVVAPAQGQPPGRSAVAVAGPQAVSAAKKKPVTVEVVGVPRAGKRFVVRGTATAKTRVVVSARKPGTKRWTPVGRSRADAHGRWRAKVRLAPGGWEVGARSAGRTALTQALVAGHTQKAVLRRDAGKLSPGQIVSVSGDPNASQTVVVNRKDNLPKVGDVLVADASPNAPHGLLGKVVSVDASALTAVIEPAALSQAYSTLQVSTSATLGQMVEGDGTASASLASLPVKFKCSSSISGGAMPTITGHVDMSGTRASFDMDLKARNPYVNLLIVGEPQLEAGLSWEAAVQAGCEVRLSAPSIPLGPTGLTLDISAVLAASLQSGGAATLASTAKAGVIVGFSVYGSKATYTRGAGIRVDWPQLSTSARTTFELGFEDEVGLMVAGRVGIFGDFGPVMDADVTLSGAQSCLDVTGALQVGLGLKADLFVTDWKVDLAKAKIGLGHLYKKCVPASGGGGTPTGPTPTPSPTPSPTGGTASPSPSPQPSSGGTIRRVSTDSSGEQGNGLSWGGHAWAPDGTQIAFSSYASNFVPNDTNASDVFVKSLTTGTIQRISVDATGTQANGDSAYPVWSPDGTRIAFSSDANNLVPNDTNAEQDVFVKTLSTGAIERVSTDSDDSQLGWPSHQPLWSPDGTKIAFSTCTSSCAGQVFVKDLASRRLVDVSTSTKGEPADRYALWPVWSPDSTRIAFSSAATNLIPGDTSPPGRHLYIKSLTTGALDRLNAPTDGTVDDWSPDGTKIAFSSGDELDPGDTNGLPDAFVQDLETGAVTRVSTDSAGGQAANCPSFGSGGAAWSPDGTKIALWSDCGTLVPGVHPGCFYCFRPYVKDLKTGAIQVVDTTWNGTLGNLGSSSTTIHWSSDGSQVSFISSSDNLVPGDTNQADDLFVKTLP